MAPRERRGQTKMPGRGKVVIAGAGLAGLRVAEELRSGGYQGSITLIGAEARPPYDRPPLSKKVLTGELDDTGLRPHLEALSVSLRPEERPTGVLHGVLLPDAADHAWDALC